MSGTGTVAASCAGAGAGASVGATGTRAQCTIFCKEHTHGSGVVRCMRIMLMLMLEVGFELIANSGEEALG